MTRRTARPGDGQGGFTLVELLVVIAILGILAGVVVFSVSGITDTGQKNSCQTEASVVRTAIESFRANDATKAYPIAGPAAATTWQVLTPGYLSKAPTLVKTSVAPGTAITPNSLQWVAATCTPAIVGISTP